MKIFIRMIALPQTSDRILTKIRDTAENLVRVETTAYWKEPRLTETSVCIENALPFEREAALTFIMSVFGETDAAELDNLPDSYEIDHYETPEGIDRGNAFWTVSFESGE